MPQILKKRFNYQKAGLQINLEGHFFQRQRVKNREIRILTLINQLVLNYVTDSGKLYETDPSEAADSENIIPSILKYFPNAEVKKTGGCIYHLALAKVLVNFQGDDEPLIKTLLLLDESLAGSGDTHYAVAMAQRI